MNEACRKWRWRAALSHPNKYERANLLWQIMSRREPYPLQTMKAHWRLFNER